MNALIQIRDKDGQQVVSARDLHSYLGSKKQFADWIKHRISKYGLIENQDYTTVSLNGENGGRATEYALTLDAAKELSMVEGNAKGKQARQYFIECERLSKINTVKLPTTKELAYLLIESETAREKAEEQKNLLEAVVKEQAPKVQYHDQVLQSVNTWVTSVIAAELQMSAMALNELLRAKGVHRKVGGVWILNHPFQGKEYTKSKTHTYTDSAGQQRTSQLTVWTEKGRAFIHGLVNTSISKSPTIVDRAFAKN